MVTVHTPLSREVFPHVFAEIPRVAAPKRTILAGMKKERENPREIEGKQALFVVNLAPREMFVITSHGMLFDIGYEDGIIPVLAMPEKAVPDGTRAG